MSREWRGDVVCIRIIVHPQLGAAPREDTCSSKLSTQSRKIRAAAAAAAHSAAAQRKTALSRHMQAGRIHCADEII
jgi:hypothetical protein